MKQAQVHGANMATKSAKADQVKEEYEESVNRMNMARVGVQCGSGHHSGNHRNTFMSKSIIEKYEEIINVTL